MPDQIRKVDYYYVTVDNAPGAGAGALKVLKDAGVSLRAMHGFPEGGKAQLDLFPEDSAALEKAAKDGNLALSAKKTAFYVEGDDRVGAMFDVLKKLGDAGINAVASDALRTGGKYAAIVWVAPGDVDRAAKVLGAK